MSSSKPSAAKRKEEGPASDPKRVRSEEEAVGAVLDLAVERDGPSSTARSVVKPALQGIIAFEGTKWRCELCIVGRGSNDGGTGATNGLMHAIKDHLSATPQAALVAYVKAARAKLEKAVQRLKDGEIAELCAAKPAAAASMDSEYFSCTTDREKKDCLARALGEGLGASNYPLSVGDSDFVGRIFHVFDPRAPRPSRRYVTKHTDLAAINAIVDVLRPPPRPRAAARAARAARVAQAARRHAAAARLRCCGAALAAASCGPCRSSSTRSVGPARARARRSRRTSAAGCPRRTWTWCATSPYRTWTSPTPPPGARGQRGPRWSWSYTATQGYDCQLHQTNFSRAVAN